MDVFSRLMGRPREITAEELGALMFEHSLQMADSLIKQLADIEQLAELPEYLENVSWDVVAREALAFAMMEADFVLFQRFGDLPERSRVHKAYQEAYDLLQTNMPARVLDAHTLNNRLRAYGETVNSTPDFQSLCFAVGCQFSDFCGAGKDAAVMAPATLLFLQNFTAMMKLLNSIKIR